MKIETLSYINNILSESGIHYSFSRWNDTVIFPYWIGEWSEIDGSEEDGFNESDFILTGTTEGSWLSLQEEKEKIENLFRNRITVLDSGIGISISFERAFTISVESDVLKRMQINLTIKEWRNY